MVERLVAKQRQRLDHAAAGPEDNAALIRNDHLWNSTDRDVIFDLIRKIVHIDHRAFDTRLLASYIEHVVSKALPATGTSGFGILSVNGRMRVPRPAASTIAVLGITGIVGKISRLSANQPILSHVGHDDSATGQLLTISAGKSPKNAISDFDGVELRLALRFLASPGLRNRTPAASPLIHAISQRR